MKLTDAAVSKLKLAAGQDELVLFDDIVAGFGFRIRQKSRRWVFRYDITSAVGRIQRKLTIGDFPAVGESKARKLAVALHIRVKNGEDPAAERAENRARAGETVGHCIGLYLEHRRSPTNKKQIRPSSYREIERHLTRNLRAIHALRIDIEPQKMRRAIADELAKFGLQHPTQAGLTRASAHSFFKWFIGRGFIEVNPVEHIERNSQPARERILIAFDKKSQKYNYDELCAVLRALPDDGDFRDIIMLLAFTGARAAEIAQLRWSEIDFEHGVIALPGSRTKNRKPHLIPLSGTTRALLEARSQRDRRDLVFGAGLSGALPVVKMQVDASTRLRA